MNNVFDLKKLTEYLLGSTQPTELFGAWVLALLGVFVSLLVDANTRDLFKSNSPIQFSWNYFIADNIFRLFKSAVILLVAVRFSDNLFGAPISPWLAFFVGIAIDRVIEYLRDLRKKTPGGASGTNSSENKTDE